MEKQDQNYLWEMIWLGLRPKTEILDWFRGSEGLYEALLAKKEALLEQHQSSDFENLQQAFYQLNQTGILAIHDAGPTMSEAHTYVQATLSDLYQAVAKEKLAYDLTQLKGYCFYHEQDTEHLVPALDSDRIPQDALYLAFGALEDADSSTAIGHRIVAVLKEAGLAVEWSGAAQTRIRINNFVWIKSNDAIHWGQKVDEEVLGAARKTKAAITIRPKFEIGEEVLVDEAPFHNYKGSITAVDREKRLVEVTVSVFGKAVPLTLSFEQMRAI